MVPHITCGPCSRWRSVAVAIVAFLLLLVPDVASAASPTWLDPQAGWHGRAIERPLAPVAQNRPASTSLTTALSAGAGFGTASGSGAVRRVQRALRELGYGVGAVDGRFGPRTRSAVGWFQRKHGLTIDGVVGPRTLERLRARTRVDSTTTTTDSEVAPQAPAPPAADDGDAQAASPAQPQPAQTVDEADPADRWLAAALAVVVILVATLLGLLVRRRRRRPAEGTVVSLAQPLWVAGVSTDPAIGPFAGTAAALHVSPPPSGSDAAPVIRYCVLDDERGTPVWVSPQDVRESRGLDARQRRRFADGLADHPAPAPGGRFARPGTRPRRGGALPRRGRPAAESRLERRVTWFRSLGMPPQAIADLLADEEIPPPHGHHEWTPEAVAQIAGGGDERRAPQPATQTTRGDD
jgi:putative peptidoglycan binding protein